MDQTVSGLTQGKELKGKIVFLGGPLHFLSGLRDRFVETLKLDGDSAVFPENAECFAAIGAALCAYNYPELSYEELMTRLESSVSPGTLTDTMPPLFENEEEYEQFKARHSKAVPETVDIAEYSGKAYLGIDAGSTTTKMVLITPEGGLLYILRLQQRKSRDHCAGEAQELYGLCGDRIEIAAGAVTGYGEELIKTPLISTWALWKQ